MPGDAWRQELAEELIGLARSEAYFRENGINGGKFDHYRPAAVLLRRQATATRAAQQDHRPAYVTVAGVLSEIAATARASEPEGADEMDAW